MSATAIPVDIVVAVDKHESPGRRAWRRFRANRLGYASLLIFAALFGLSPYDPLSLLAAVSVLLAAGAAAILIPARRAARVDPASVLREA